MRGNRGDGLPVPGRTGGVARTQRLTPRITAHIRMNTVGDRFMLSVSLLWMRRPVVWFGLSIDDRQQINVEYKRSPTVGRGHCRRLRASSRAYVRSNAHVCWLWLRAESASSLVRALTREMVSTIL